MTLGKFITLEGGEGTGKSTQTRILADSLKNRGLGVVETREPGGTSVGASIRALVLEGKRDDFSPLCEALLFCADRAEHIAKVIRPSLEQGTWVISDRYMDSTRAYQGLAGRIAPRVIDDLERIVVADAVPDLTVLLDMPAEASLKRAEERRRELPGEGKNKTADRFESRDLSFHEALRECFLNIAKDNSDRFAVVDASQKPEEVAKDIWKAVSERLLD